MLWLFPAIWDHLLCSHGATAVILPGKLEVSGCRYLVLMAASVGVLGHQVHSVGKGVTDRKITCEITRGFEGKRVVPSRIPCEMVTTIGCVRIMERQLVQFFSTTAC